MLTFSLLLFSSVASADAPSLEVFNRSDPSYDVSTFTNKGEAGSCRVDLVAEFKKAGCTRANVRGYDNIEQFMCYDRVKHPELADYYIIYRHDLLAELEGNTPSENSPASSVHCVDENYTVFAWNIF